MRLELRGSYGDIDGEAWDALVGDRSPFLEHTFLWGLEKLGCAVPETGWTPRPVLLFDDSDQLIGAAPGWGKHHSMGEFVYDHAWADAAHRAGLDYYPKLIVGVPFTPATGDRLLVRPGPEANHHRAALVQGLQAASDGLAGLHILFNPEEEATWLDNAGMFRRSQFQFHWRNQSYRSFEHFLERFPSKKRNKIRRERKATQNLRIEAIEAPDRQTLDALHRFYAATCEQFGPWGRVYLSPDFFQYLGEHWGHRLLPVVAFEGDTPVAGAFNVVKGDRLYGRHWGCEADHKFLHFEVCYYQAIDACIERGLAVFEPGHGGGHKYTRGFEPVVTWSSHWLRHDGLHEALRRHTAQEREWVDQRVSALTEQLPFKDVPGN